MEKYHSNSNYMAHMTAECICAQIICPISTTVLWTKILNAQEPQNVVLWKMDVLSKTHSSQKKNNHACGFSNIQQLPTLQTMLLWLWKGYLVTEWVVVYSQHLHQN